MTITSAGAFNPDPYSPELLKGQNHLPGFENNRAHWHGPYETGVAPAGDLLTKSSIKNLEKFVYLNV